MSRTRRGALREVWQADEKGAYGMLPFVASRLRKTKGGTPTGDSPGASAVEGLLDKTDEDPNWFPGKRDGKKSGRKRVLRGPKKSAVVSAAKRIKAEGGEPTYSAMVAACPKALINPDTEEPVDTKAVFAVFRESCYDEDPSRPWANRPRLSRTALDEDTQAKRWAWAKYMLSLRHAGQWYVDNLVWCDLCNSVLPRTRKKASEQALARKGGKGWMSDGTQGQSANLRGPLKVLKMNSSDTVRVWWVPILSRGKLHVEPLPDNFPGETEEGAATMVARVRAALNVRFHGGSQPKVLLTDRGNGFYQSGSGSITDGYRDALREHGLKAFMGADASAQPGNLQELLLHETAVSWMRVGLAKTVPKECWAETLPAYRSRLKAVCANINAKHDVAGLCRELPERVADLDQRKGDRLAK